MVKTIKEKLIIIALVIVTGTLISYHVYTWFDIPSFLHSVALANTNKTVSTVSKPIQIKSNTTKSNTVIPILYEPTRIRIPSVGIDLAVTDSIQLSQTEWQISDTKVNFAEGTSLPNTIGGNTVLFAHDRDKLFASLHNVHTGDTIYIDTPNLSLTYKANKEFIVDPSQISIMAPTLKPTLTLFTCDGWLSFNRYVVTANLISAQSK